MNTEEAYVRFLDKVNKNATNDNVSADKGRFVSLYNDYQNRFVEWTLEKKNEDDIRDIQKLLVMDKELTLKGKLLNHQNFELPSDYFSFENVQAFASNKTCKNKRIFLTEIKSGNREDVLIDEFHKPSFKAREAPYLIADDSVIIYVDEFDISKTYLTYYRYPVQIDLEGYYKEDNSHSVTINPELDDKIVNRIITACAKGFNLNNNDLQNYQFDKDNIISKI